jgi:hypothetical protein
MLPAGSRQQNLWYQSLQLEDNIVKHSHNVQNLVEEKQCKVLQGQKSAEDLVSNIVEDTNTNITTLERTTHTHTQKPKLISYST